MNKFNFILFLSMLRHKSENIKLNHKKKINKNRKACIWKEEMFSFVTEAKKKCHAQGSRKKSVGKYTFSN